MGYTVILYPTKKINPSHPIDISQSPRRRDFVSRLVLPLLGSEHHQVALERFGSEDPDSSIYIYYIHIHPYSSIFPKYFPITSIIKMGSSSELPRVSRLHMAHDTYPHQKGRHLSRRCDSWLPTISGWAHHFCSSARNIHVHHWVGCRFDR